jgi:hypothetical protein
MRSCSATTAAASAAAGWCSTGYSSSPSLTPRRAKRGPGSTRKAIEQAGQVENWWFPFSMADDGEASAEPAFAFAVSAKVPTPLLRLM